MSPRRKTAPDDEVVKAAARVLCRVGPGEFRLADVAAEVGLAPATLIQRFESKRGLLLAVAEAGIAMMKHDFARRRAEARSPLDAITAIRTCVRRQAESPEALAHSLSFIQLGLTDPEFHRLARAHQRALEREMRQLVEAAMAAGELEVPSPRRLASAIVAIFRGSLLTWAFHREGSLDVWLRQDLETLLAPYRTSATQARARRGEPRRPAGGNGRGTLAADAHRERTPNAPVPPRAGPPASAGATRSARRTP